ncbi:pseudaminic acid cytidylyltransferase [Vibrio cholerae]
MKVLFIIPARGGSKRIPNKNIKMFLGKEIISYPISAALCSKYCSRLIVSTDSEKIRSVAIKYGAEVPFLRSDNNSNDFATTYDVINEVCSKLIDIDDYDYICCIYPTSVFVTDEVLNKAFSIIESKKCGGVVSVLEYSHPIQRALRIESSGYITPINAEFYNTRSQDLEKMYHDAGQFYIFRLNDAQKEKKLIVKNSIPLIIHPARAQDIDNLDDWVLAEIKYKYSCYE